jgi:arylsulfatase A-like enzyme
VSHPNVLILIFDALSAKNASLYGYPRQTMPFIERAAQRAVVFHRHFAGGTYTTPGTATLLTGAYPWSHRAFHLYGETSEAFTDRNIFRLFKATHRTFAYTHNPFANILLNQFGGHIANFVPPHELEELSVRMTANLSSEDYTLLSQAEDLTFWKFDSPPASIILSRILRTWHLSQEAALNRRYAGEFPLGVPNSTISYFTLERALDWLAEEVQAAEPFLGYVHLLPPHFPYTPRADTLGRFQGGWQPAPKPASVFSEKRDDVFLNFYRRQYDEFVAYCDAEFGRLFERLENSGRLDDTILVLTSDHGEMFERGIWAHSNPTLYQPLLHVPLLVWLPGRAARRDVYAPTSAVDLLPTLLDLAGLPMPDWAEGTALLGGAQPPQSRSLFAMDFAKNPKSAPLVKGSSGIVRDGYKLTNYAGYAQGDFAELYDLENDPEELVNLAGKSPALVKSLLDELRAGIEAADGRVAAS